MESLGWLYSFEDGSDGVEKLAGFEDLSETVVEEGGNERLDLSLDRGTVRHAETIRQRIFTVGTQHRERSSPQGLGGKLPTSVVRPRFGPFRPRL